MIKTVKLYVLFLTILWISAYGPAAMALITVVAAENVYGDVAKQLGGPYVKVINILNNPTQDPHLFSILPSTAKTAVKADIIVYNGADYDPWMKSLLTIHGSKKRSVIVVAELIGVQAGKNPHIWYMPETIPAFAQNMTAILSEHDPEHQNYFKQQLHQFNNQYQVIFNMVKKLKNTYYNTPVIATEPLFNYMATSIGLDMHGLNFQINIMNDVPPTISQIKQFETDLQEQKVRALIYNSQVANPVTKRMLTLAQKNGVPIVGVTEMLPPGMTYVEWMMKQLTELETALASTHGH